MTIKRFISIILALLMLPTLALGDTAGAPYIPGSVTHDLFAEAFDRGDMILADAQFGLLPGSNAAALYGDDAALLAPIAEALEHASLTVGAGRMENGLRLLLGAQYAPDEAQSAELYAILELTDDGVALTSSVIPGERFTATWESLLSLAGVDDSSAAMILSLRGADLEALAAELMAQLPALLEAAGQLAAPYGETILSQITALPIERHEDVPAEGGYPAAASELYIPVSFKDVGSLLDALAAQLEQDAMLSMFLDMALAQSGEEITTAELCAAVREAAAGMTDETPVFHTYIGFDEAGSPLYLHASAQNADDSSLVLSCTFGEGETAGSSATDISLLVLSSDEHIEDGITLFFESLEDPSDSRIGELTVGFIVYEDDAATAEISFYTGTAAAPTEDGQDGYAGTHALGMASIEGDVSDEFTVFVDFTQSKTAEGGEQFAAVGSLELLSQEDPFSASFEGYMLTTPTAEGPTASITEFTRLPALGIDEYHQSTTFYTAAYTPEEQLADTALETATYEELEALAARAVSSLETTLRTLLELLPEELAKAIR